MKLAKHVSVSFDESGYKITRYLNLGSKDGFEPQPDIASLASSSTAVLGEALISLLAETA